MIISLTAEYALRAMIHLASVKGSDGAQTVGKIAEETRVPAGYLAKVLQSLGRAGLISSQRGLGGGFRLLKPAAVISIHEVVQAVDPIQRIHECPLGLEAHGTNLCPLHRRLDDAMALIESQFRQTTIAELLEVGPADKETAMPGTAPRSSFGEGCVFPLTPRDDKSRS